MSDKYIIKNCPCFVEGIAIKGNEQKTQTCNNHKVRELTYCADITDCKLKQIVDILKKNTCKPEECGMNKPDWNGEVYGCNAGFDDNVSGCSCALANNLLAKFDIQEVE